MKSAIFALCVAAAGLIGTMPTANAANVFGTKVTRVHVSDDISFKPAGGVWFSTAASHATIGCGGNPYEYFINLNTVVGKSLYDQVMKAFSDQTILVNVYGDGSCAPATYSVEGTHEVQLYR